MLESEKLSSMPTCTDETQALPSPAFPQLNFLNQFYDPALVDALRVWNESNDSIRARFFVDFISLLLVGIFIPHQVWELKRQVVDGHSIIHILLTCVGLAVLIVSTLSSITVSLINHHWDLACLQAIAAKCSRTTLCSSTFFGVIVSYTILFFHNYVLAAESYVQHDGWVPSDCRDPSSRYFALSYQICGMYMVFIVFFVHCPCLRIEFVWAMLAITVMAAAVAIAHTDEPTKLLAAFLFWTACTYTVVLDVHLRNISLFLLHKQGADETVELTSGLKHSIANVAHDLKTPLSSFSNAVEMVQTLWQDIVEAMQREDQPVVQVRGSQLVDCLKSIQCTNSFMTMAINRCLDATKASDNMKLTAKNVSVNLMDAVNLPLSIMRTMQQKLAVQLELDPSVLQGQVASHILTDAHWLQENILCLLSNAVKYSGHGQVVLRLIAASHAQHPLQISRPSSSLYSLQGDIEENAVSLETATFELLKEGGEEGEKVCSWRDLDLGGPSKSRAHTTCIRYLVFEVEDEGIGISEAARRKLFLPFQQSQRLAGGTGLGLYSLAKRMEALDGRYGVRGRRDGKPGSLFWFSIPYRPDLLMSQGVCVAEQGLSPCPYSSDSLERGLGRTEQDAQPMSRLPSASMCPVEVPRESVATTAQPREGAVHILLVDDCTSILKMTSIMMHRLGVCVSTAGNGVEALDALEACSHPFDAAFMDLQMPVMDGIEAIRRMRAHSDPRIRGLPVVGLSANADEDTRRIALEAGASRFLPKPLTIAAIAEIVQDLSRRGTSSSKDSFPQL